MTTEVLSSASAPTLENGARQSILVQPSKHTKLHGRAFYNSIGCPKFVVAPMVDQSEFVWSRPLSSQFLITDALTGIVGMAYANQILYATF